MIDHNFADPDTLSYYYGSCQTDPNSAGCRYFNMRLEEDTDELNPYSNLYILLQMFMGIVSIMIHLQQMDNLNLEVMKVKNLC